MQVELKTKDGIIKGETSFNHTGNQKNLIEIEFCFDSRHYKFPFSRKTGKLYAYKLPFEIKLVTLKDLPEKPF